MIDSAEPDEGNSRGERNDCHPNNSIFISGKHVGTLINNFGLAVPPPLLASTSPLHPSLPLFRLSLLPQPILLLKAGWLLDLLFCIPGGCFFAGVITGNFHAQALIATELF